MAVIGSAEPSAPHAIVVDGAGPWQDSNWTAGVTAFTSLLTDAGYEISVVAPADLPNTSLAGNLLAVPNLASLPLATFQTVAAFLASGGTLMATGGQPFGDPLYLSNGQWLDANALLAALTPAQIALDPSAAVLTEYIGVEATVTQTTVTGEDGTSKAQDFQIQIPAQAQYLLYTAAVPQPPFGPGQNATIVYTRGTPGQSMLFEWNYADGSRWVATVPLTAQWTKQILLPSAFQYFSGGTPPAAGVSFDPTQATTLFFGVSTGFGANPGPLEFALGPIGTASAPQITPFTPPIVETLSPSYKQYVTERAGQTVRVPVGRGRGQSATANSDGSYRTIGDPLNPDATRYVTNSGAVVFWLPLPELQDPSRTQLVAMLSAASSHVFLMNAGPGQIVVLPSEGITLGATAANWSSSSVSANLIWSITDANGTAVAHYTSNLNIPAGQLLTVPDTQVGAIPTGDYTVTANLVAGKTQVDSITSLVRVFNPTASYQPSKRIIVSKGNFAIADGQRIFLQGVNYWPRTIAGVEPAFVENQSWLDPQNYDPNVIEADLTELQSLHFNLVSIQYFNAADGRSLMDFLDRCREHGMWANIAISAFVPVGSPQILMYGVLEGVNANIAAPIQAALLSGNDRVFAYDLLWEPALFPHANRLPLDPAWRQWLTEQYGSAANAQQAWGFTAPVDDQGQVSNPLDSQIENDGNWRVMVAAYRRFADDYLGRSLGAASRLVRAASPGTLLSYRNGEGTWSYVNNTTMGYDLGTGAAHMDFLSSELYGCCSAVGGITFMTWPDARGYGFGAAYGRYRGAGKPVYWAEFGFGMSMSPTATELANQSSTCDAMMELVSEDGSSAASVWWMPGGWRVDTAGDYGILNPDGSPRGCAQTLSQFGAQFASTPPSPGSGTPVTLTVDRDADARGQYGLYLDFLNQYVQAKQAGSPVVLHDPGTGTDTSSMPQVQIGNVPYTGTGPLKYANGEFAGMEVKCGSLNVTAENNTEVHVPSGSPCQITPVVVNTGSAAWLAGSQPKAGVILHTSAGDVPLQNSLGYLQRASIGPIQVPAVHSNVNLTGRLTIQGSGSFGENLNLTLVPGSGDATPASALQLVTTGLPNGLAGLSYVQPIAASGGTAPYAWSISSGAVPPGLQLQANTGSLEGTLTQAGSYTFTVQVSDSASQIVSQPFTVTVHGTGLVNAASFSPTFARGAMASIFSTQLAAAPMSANTVPLPRRLDDTQVRTAQIVDPVIMHAKGGLVTPSNPATANEVLIAYGTGIGALDHPPATGAPAPSKPLANALLTPMITVGSAYAIPLFTGLAPGFVGVAQFNFQLPAKLPGRPTLPLTITFGEASSQTVNLYVR